jgi:hypothetical protein
MATQFARTQPAAMPVPFMLRDSGPRRSRLGFAEAFAAAVAAERAGSAGRKPCQRVARLLCELGKAYGCDEYFPLGRSALSSALGISAVRVKRTLALLSLSGVVECEGDEMRVVDWRKLSGLARFDPAGLDLASVEEEDEPSSYLQADEAPRFLTASGDPACFV